MVRPGLPWFYSTFNAPTGHWLASETSFSPLLARFAMRGLGLRRTALPGCRSAVVRLSHRLCLSEVLIWPFMASEGTPRSGLAAFNVPFQGGHGDRSGGTFSGISWGRGSNVVT
ncbi:hypothetical protein Acy02nite_69040 [Actinoplanes cyaneus]|uniref:Uncharacterized protein n=1 Tax=Actinoplanes cyaneus TaxID=52696 RepID=A0A919M930_9ACTN|nr:hypothetical protein Acy02nite_69040 [Actinoplanes cyaneus]